VKHFYCFLPGRARVSADFPAVHFEDFPVHTISTGYTGLSARRGRYPPAYAQLTHKLPSVSRQAQIERLLDVTGWYFPATSVAN
jgi:hypothetical protein